MFRSTDSGGDAVSYNEMMLLVIALCAAVAYGLPRMFDLIAHIYRYRRYLRQYPATKDMRGHVWKHTA